MQRNWKNSVKKNNIVAFRKLCIRASLWSKTDGQCFQGVTFTDPITEVNRVIDEIETRAAAEGKNYKNYVVLAHLGVDTTTPTEWRGSTLAEALSKNPKLKGKRVTVIDGHSHTVESTTYGDNVTYNQTDDPLSKR